MILAGLLNILVVVALVMAAAATIQLKMHSARAKMRILGPVVVAIALATVSALACFVTRIQEATGVNLHVPSTMTFKARAREWMIRHQAQPPDPQQVARNVRIVADGVLFFDSYRDSFPPAARAQMAEYGALPKKIDHVLSYSEEQRYYTAAQGVFTLIGSFVAETAPTGNPKP